MRNSVSPRLSCLAVAAVFCLPAASQAEEQTIDTSLADRLIFEIQKAVEHNSKGMRRFLCKAGKLTQALASHRAHTASRFSADSLRDAEGIEGVNRKISKFETSLDDLHFTVWANRDEMERNIQNTRKEALHGMRNSQMMNVAGLVMCAVLFLSGWIVIFVRQSRTNQKLAAVDDVFDKVYSLDDKIDLALETFCGEHSRRTKKNDVCRDAVLDHSLACIVTSEIFRLRRKINNGSNGSEITKRTLSRLEDELVSRGYAVRDMTGLHYSDGMAVRVVNFLVSDQVKPGEEKIERMIKPEISFKGRIVEPGTAEVSVSPVNNVAQSTAASENIERGKTYEQQNN